MIVKKTLLLVVAFLLLVPFASIDGSDVSSLNNSNGNILYVGGSGPNNYTSIQDAIDDAGDGATIYVYPGLYHESIVVDKQLNLIGREEDGEKPTIQARENHSALLILADRCAVRGFIMKSQEILISDNNPPSCEIQSDSNVIENNTFMYGESTVRLNKSSYNLFTNNVITNGYREGIETIDSNENIISYNSVRDNTGEGIELNGGLKSVVSYNEVTKNGDGIEIWYSDNNIVSFNHVHNNDQYGITTAGCTRLNVSNNSIHNHAYGGVSVADSSNCTISGNELYSNQAGVRLYGTIGVNYEGSTHNVVTRNNIHGNGVGIYWESGCKNNYFTYNNIVDNSENAYFWTSLEIGDPDFPLHRPCQNIWNRNYWSDWTTSVPKPIRGMVTVWLSSFYIDLPWLTFDKHPATEPYGNNTLPNAEKYTDATAFIRETISLPPTSLPQTSNSLPRSPPR